jgi:hypothetical protein
MATSYWLPDQGRQVTKEGTDVTDNCVANSSYPTKVGRYKFVSSIYCP